MTTEEDMRQATDVCDICERQCSDPTLAIAVPETGSRYCGPECYGRSKLDGPGRDPVHQATIVVDVRPRHPSEDYTRAVGEVLARKKDVRINRRGERVYGSAPGAAPSFDSTTIAAPARERCGCGHHDIDPAGDVYAQHRDWCYRNAKRDPAGRSDPREWNAAALRDEWACPGIGISAPGPELLTVDDATGDDVARDAYRTTGGRTLDDVIDAHRALLTGEGL